MIGKLHVNLMDLNVLNQHNHVNNIQEILIHVINI